MGAAKYKVHIVHVFTVWWDEPPSTLNRQVVSHSICVAQQDSNGIKEDHKGINSFFAETCEPQICLLVVLCKPELCPVR